jgi:hypothetical protein
MGDSMSTIINATTTNGVVIQPDNSGSLQLATNSGTTAVTINTSQNVGIGTASPLGKLDVVVSSGRNRMRNSTGSESFLLFQNSDTGTATSDGFAIGIGTSEECYLYNQENTPILFGTNDTERMRIDSTGNTLINTTTNTRTAKFRVYKSGDNVMETETDNTGSGYIHIGFINPNGRVGYITTTGSSTTYSTSSDYRLKENIAPMTGALDTITQLKPVTYTWIVDGSSGQGFIAHELQAIIPECVSGEKDAIDAEGNAKYQGVDTSFLVATLTAAIQEQQTIINDLKARVTVLEAK